MEDGGHPGPFKSWPPLTLANFLGDKSCLLIPDNELSDLIKTIKEVRVVFKSFLLGVF